VPSDFYTFGQLFCGIKPDAGSKHKIVYDPAAQSPGKTSAKLGGASAGVAYPKGAFRYKPGVRSNIDGGNIGTNVVHNTRIDLCKILSETVCNQRGYNNFCKQPGNGDLCCPLNGVKPAAQAKVAKPKALAGAYAGCPPKSKVAGVARAFMPQVSNPSGPAIKVGAALLPPNTLASAAVGTGENAFVTWVRAQGAPWAAFDILLNTQVQLDAIKPSQDEVFAHNTMQKICHPKGGGAASGTPPLPPLICSDDYILDGHHRWSQTKMCPLVAGCAPYANPKQYAVHKANKPCGDIIRLVQSQIDYNNPALAQPFVPLDQAGQDSGQSGTSVKSAAGTLEFAFGGFVELEAKFGRAAHTTAAQAEAAYINTTRERLARGGLELKGGDEALRDWWRARHASRLWNDQTK